MQKSEFSLHSSKGRSKHTIITAMYILMSASLNISKPNFTQDARAFWLKTNHHPIDFTQCVWTNNRIMTFHFPSELLQQLVVKSILKIITEIQKFS